MLSRYFQRFAVLVIGLFWLGSEASAQNAISLEASRDNTLYESASGALSNGAGGDLFVGKTNGGFIRRALVRFELNGVLPPSASIDSVALTLQITKTISGDKSGSIHFVTTDWGEGASTALVNGGGSGTASENGDATWLHTFHDGSLWTSPGGDFDNTPSATTIFGPNGPVRISSTVRLTDDVRDWIERPDDNFGWLLRGDETANATAKRFDSRESASESTRPSLTIYFSIPTLNEPEFVPTASRLLDNYPNPFSKRTTISYELGEPQTVSLTIYDALGRRVKTLVSDWQSAGRHDAGFAADGLAGGFYFYALATKEGTQTGKMLLVR